MVPQRGAQAAAGPGPRWGRLAPAAPPYSGLPGGLVARWRHYIGGVAKAQNRKPRAHRERARYPRAGRLGTIRPLLFLIPQDALTEEAAWKKRAAEAAAVNNTSNNGGHEWCG